MARAIQLLPPGSRVVRCHFAPNGCKLAFQTTTKDRYSNHHSKCPFNPEVTSPKHIDVRKPKYHAAPIEVELDVADDDLPLACQNKNYSKNLDTPYNPNDPTTYHVFAPHFMTDSEDLDTEDAAVSKETRIIAGERQIERTLMASTSRITTPPRSNFVSLDDIKPLKGTIAQFEGILANEEQRLSRLLSVKRNRALNRSSLTSREPLHSGNETAIGRRETITGNNSDDGETSFINDFALSMNDEMIQRFSMNH